MEQIKTNTFINHRNSRAQKYEISCVSSGKNFSRVSG